MQIEFYLPLPPDGFWAALIVYYMLGLAVTVYYVVKWDIKEGGRITWYNIGAAPMLLFVVTAWIWPALPISYYRNR